MLTKPLAASVFSGIALASIGVGSLAAAAVPAMVPVGNKGNPSDSTGYGSVAYDYRIGAYEVTVGEYVDFLNAAAKTDPYGLFSGNQPIARSGSSGAYVYQAVGSGRKPISNVSWFNAARYANWLHHGGRVTSSTETGAYTLNGAIAGTSYARNQNAIYFLPTINEWYKAAYYDPAKSGTSSYWRFPTRSDTAPGNSLAVTPNQANYFRGETGAATYPDYRLVDVGSYGLSASAYGTFDQGGNVWEWNELILSGSQRGQRGGSVYSSNWQGTGDLYAGTNEKQDIWNTVNLGNVDIGFRIASVEAVFIDIRTGTQTQAQAGYGELPQAVPLVKSGAGTLVLDQGNTLSERTTVTGGVVRLANPTALLNSTVEPLSGGRLELASGVSATLGGLAANAGGLIDVGDGLVTVRAGLSASQLTAALAAGRGDGSWNGTSGVVSSVAASSNGMRAVGWLDNGDGSVTFGYAAPGDATLDGTVDILDVAYFLVSGKFGTGSLASWRDGDFNYDGMADILDASELVASGLYNEGPYGATALSVAAVPEPSAIMTATCAVLICISCYRRLGRVGSA
jgi:autotransporter-associated beta strand protein